MRRLRRTRTAHAVDPSYVIRLLLAVIAAGAASHRRRPRRDDAGSFPGWSRYAVAVGCLVIAAAGWFRSRDA